MAYNGVDLAIDPLYIQTKSYDAKSDRKWFSDLASPGIIGSGDYNVTYQGTLLNLTVAAGVAWVKGGNIADQGMYRQYTSASVQVTCPAANGSNPRIDTVILRVFDNAADSSALNKARIDVVPGTATSGANLTNLTGKDPLTSLTDASLSFIVLAYILVPAGATTLTNTATNVKDARTRATVGSGGAISSGVPNDGSVTAAKLAAGAAAGQAYGTSFPTVGLYNGYRYTLFVAAGGDGGPAVGYDCIYRADLDGTYPWIVMGQAPQYQTSNLTIPGSDVANFGTGAYLYGPRNGVHSVWAWTSGGSIVGGAAARLNHSSAGVIVNDNGGSGNQVEFAPVWQGTVTTAQYVQLQGATGGSSSSWDSKITMLSRRIV